MSWCGLLPWHLWSAWNRRADGKHQYRICGLCGLMQEREVGE